MNNRDSTDFLGEMQRLLKEMKQRRAFSSEKIIRSIKQLDVSYQALTEANASVDVKPLLDGMAQTISDMQKQFSKVGALFDDKNLLNEFRMQISLYKQKIRPAVTQASSLSSSKSMYQRLQQNSQAEVEIVTRSRADGTPPPPVIHPAAPTKSNVITVPANSKRQRDLPPIPTVSSSGSASGSPDRKVVRRETTGVELSNLANQLDNAAKLVTSNFGHAGRSSMANILRKGDHVKDADVMLFVKYYQEETNNIKNLVKNAFPPEVAVLLAKKPNELVRADNELFKAIVSVNPQETLKPGSSK